LGEGRDFRDAIQQPVARIVGKTQDDVPLHRVERARHFHHLRQLDGFQSYFK